MGGPEGLLLGHDMAPVMMNGECLPEGMKQSPHNNMGGTPHRDDLQPPPTRPGDMNPYAMPYNDNIAVYYYIQLFTYVDMTKIVRY